MERLELYALITAEIASGRPENDVLAARGLDEASFAALEREIEDALSRALSDPGDAPAPFVVAYERAMLRAQASVQDGTQAMSFEDFGRAVAAISSGRDPLKALEAIGLSASAVAGAVARWGTELAKDPARVAELERLRAGDRPAAQAPAAEPESKRADASVEPGDEA